MHVKFFFFLFDSHGVTAYGLLENQENTMQCTDKAAFLFSKNNNKNKIKNQKKK